MDPETQRKIAQKGGEAVSRDREHMSMIGRKGGEASGGGNRGGNPQNPQGGGTPPATNR
jgi:general stress protein YciG